jgi:7-cyano-7-deazaguanine synthase
MKAEDIKIPQHVRKAVVSMSGGLDSTTLTYLLVNRLGADNVFAISYNYGQKQSLELEMAAATCTKLGIAHKIIDISFLGDIVAPICSNVKGSQLNTPTIKEVLGDPQPSSTVPFRNSILFTIAMAYAESNDCDGVFVGVQVVDFYGYWDATEDFIQAMNNVAVLNRKKYIRLISPFGRLTKADEIQIGTELGVDYSLTLTCYNPDEHGKSCGVCATCAERIKAFKDVNIIDPVEYQIPIKW